GRVQGVRGSWGALMRLCRVLGPRRDRSHQAMTVCRHGPRVREDEGSPRVRLISGLNGRRGRWLSTLRSAACTAPRKTRFRLLARLYRVGLVTHKAPTKGFRGNRYISSSLPKLFLAQYEKTPRW